MAEAPNKTPTQLQHSSPSTSLKDSSPSTSPKDSFPSTSPKDSFLSTPTRPRDSSPINLRDSSPINPRDSSPSTNLRGTTAKATTTDKVKAKVSSTCTLARKDKTRTMGRSSFSQGSNLLHLLTLRPT